MDLATAIALLEKNPADVEKIVSTLAAKVDIGTLMSLLPSILSILKTIQAK